MNSTTTAQFEAAWCEVERQQRERLRASTERLNAEVERELTLLLAGVRDALTEDQRDIQSEFDKLIRMVEQFQQGVDMWQLKAKSSIKMIEEKQRNFALLVEETSIRAAANRRDSIDRLQKRAIETEAHCQQLIAAASKSM
ncbi:conserved hypothetical protein [Leishmania infantum JPCM5]|uniref:Uncharacterized protein n=2 Tax=Leishmania infantum TaxID=5671 RepID=A4I2M6_LEIIN|nr:conserved hypothetical protein [Leishmania infantum JPCM5]CAC9498743.1 hypothetical_protein_-_conserved [Leishmania infantum]CAM69021.1 conserved hypothetical protein [Leishmania infantum JPCM5]SUZ42912.1 hypothetical_protein_-_conserved [Leishmania infantum]|eukprot:XP_001466309.1 conserved hypothetical protein [Leishmania infantum JPCM5]